MRIRPITDQEYEVFIGRSFSDYAASHVAAGTWSEEDALANAIRETEALLPEGRLTPGMLFLTAEDDDGAAAGSIWVAVTGPRGEGALVYQLEVDEEHRRRGVARMLLEAAEEEVRRHGVSSIGLNVFADNPGAFALYESVGYTTRTFNMRKDL